MTVCGTPSIVHRASDDRGTSERLRRQSSCARTTTGRPADQFLPAERTPNLRLHAERGEKIAGDTSDDHVDRLDPGTGQDSRGGREHSGFAERGRAAESLKLLVVQPPGAVTGAVPAVKT